MAKPIKKRVGRPTKRTPDVTTEIFARLSDGEPLAAICRDAHTPHWMTVYDWREKDEEFRLEFARARDRGYDAIAQRLRKTARGMDEANGGETSGDVQRDKLIVDTDLKLLAKWSPKRYGDGAQLRLADADGNKLDPMDDAATVSRLASLFGTIAQRHDDADGD